MNSRFCSSSSSHSHTDIVVILVIVVDVFIVIHVVVTNRSVFHSCHGNGKS